MNHSSTERISKGTIAAIVVAALGYFVDIYDLILFSIVRVKSLTAIGVPEGEIFSQGVLILNMQMGGMLLGGLLWGILGDKKGRLSVLLGSILMYSLANIATGFVHDVPMYAFLRFIAGIGLAGELGAGITLVSELMPKHLRGYGTMIISSVGILGAIVAAVIGDKFDWRIVYFIGGGMGIILLLLRIKVSESGMFQEASQQHVKRGSLSILLKDVSVFSKYLNCIIIGIPLWFVVGILITFSPEFGKALNMPALPVAGHAIMYTYIGLSLGSLLSGGLSQILSSRIKATAIFMVLNLIFICVYLFSPGLPLSLFYLICFALGIASGYWALFVTIAAEQFGTNIRATVATTVPNFVRGSVVPVTLSFQYLKGHVGIIHSALIIGLILIVLAFLALKGLEETYHKDLNYLEK